MIKKYCTLTTLFFIFYFAIFSACTKYNNKDTSLLSKEQIIHISTLPQGWYSLQPEQLNKDIDSYLSLAKKYFSVDINNAQVKALIVPHAGHYYSGLCAACGYQTLLGPNDTKNSAFSRVIILCPSHRVFLNNIAIPNYNIYKTCLGNLEVDIQAISKLVKSGPVFRTNSEAHELEHAIEVQLPFLQKTLSHFKIVPLIVGDLTPESFNNAIKGLKRIIDDSTLMIISSDFTHFGQNYEFTPFEKTIFHQIRYLDALAIKDISSFSGYDFEQLLQKTKASICGKNPISLLLGLIQEGVYTKISVKLACYYTSAQLIKAISNGIIDPNKLLDPLSDNECQNSVSYASLVFVTQPATAPNTECSLTDFDKKSLLKLARQSIQNSFKSGTFKLPEYLLYPIITPALQQQSGAFVTLTAKNGDLRGCIGQILTHAPLYKTVSEMAISSAFNDSRFSPLKEYELDNIVIDITILTTPQKIASYKDIKIGRDGIILKKIGTDGQISASAVFLPQVAENFGWDLLTTLSHLSQKAGMGQNEWKTNCEFETFQGFEIKEK